MDKCSIFPKEGEVFLMEAGVIGKRKRIIYIEPKTEKGNVAIISDIERNAMPFIFFEVYAYFVRSRSKKLYYHLFDSCPNTAVDHKISVRTCFLNRVSIEDAAHVDNLQLLSRCENSKKQSRNYVDLGNEWIAQKYGIKYELFKK